MGNSLSDLCCQLRSAAQNGDVNTCVEVIRQGARVNCQDNLFQSTPLHEACRYGHHQVAQLLIDRGAQIDARDCIGQSALFYAAKGGFDSIVQLLIDRGANVNMVGNKGKTPLHTAMQFGKKVAALLLLENGADLGAVDEDGLTPCQLAARCGSLKCLLVCHCIFEQFPNVGKKMDLSDREIPDSARLLLEQWFKAIVRGQYLQIPPEETFENMDKLKQFFNCAGACDTKCKRKCEEMLASTSSSGSCNNSNGTSGQNNVGHKTNATDCKKVKMTDHEEEENVYTMEQKDNDDEVTRSVVDDDDDDDDDESSTDEESNVPQNPVIVRRRRAASRQIS